MKTNINGIIIEGKVYEAEIGFDHSQCDHCDLSEICDDYFGGLDDIYPCTLFAPTNRVYLHHSQSLTDKLNNQ